MTKFLCSVAGATLIICFFSCFSYAQTSNLNTGTEITFEQADSLSNTFIKKYKNGFLRKNPEGYMIAFSKKELLALLQSVPDADSISIVLGASSNYQSGLKSKYDGPKIKPLVIFQFKTPPSSKYMYGDYVYKLAGTLCPPPIRGCKVEETPSQN